MSFIDLLQNPIFFDMLIPLPIFLIGIGFLIASKIRFAVPIGYVGISLIKPQKTYREGWYWGLPPRDCSLVRIDTKTINIPLSDEDNFEIETPDNGVLNARVMVIYSPDDSTSERLIAFSGSSNLDDVLSSRVRSALKSWAWQKPFPGTARRAVANKADAEKAIVSKLTGVSMDTLVLFADTESLNRYSILDLGIVIREVHLVDFREIKRGSNKPDWGDDDLLFDAEKVRMRLRQKVSSLSDLREEKARLIVEFPTEEDSIEDLYDEERIRSMEHRDH
jgi:hypothetical protein